MAYNPTLLTLVIPLFLLHLRTTTAATSPPPSSTTALAPTPLSSPPPNITKILQKADEFSRFVGLLRTTHIADRLETQLDPAKSNNNQGVGGLTIFAPNDNAFADLKSGSINSLSYDQITKLVLFHCVPSFLSFSSLQTAVNPIRTEAGDIGAGQYPLNITAVGTQVKLSSGVRRDHASVWSTIYSNSTQRLAIYEVDKLLAPKAIFPVTPLEDVGAPVVGPGPTSALNRRKKKDDGVAPVADGKGGGSRSVRSARASPASPASSTSGTAECSMLYCCLVLGFWWMLLCW